MLAANSTLTFRPVIQDFVTARENSHYTVLCGGNNSGKSLVLKNMKYHLGRRAYMVGPVRFYHVHEISTQRFNKSDYDSWDSQFRSQAQNIEYNYEQNYIDLSRILGGLKDARRHQLFEICGQLIGNTFSLKKQDEENELSLRYVDMDGQNLAVGSTGTRLLMTLLGLCMDDQFDVVLIDEPELGLSPRVQTALAGFLSDAARRAEYFPHLKGVFMATHSHLFLDRSNISNNHIVSKTGSDVAIRSVSNMSELHELQFNLLGNSLETLFLPSAIVIVEGKTDKPYIEKVLQLSHPGRSILTIEGQGDVKRIFRNLCVSLGDIYKSPFRDRTFVVLDSVNTPGTREDLVQMGAKPENVVTWNANGIEYLFPPSIIANVFACSEGDVSKIEISGDVVSLNGVQRRKQELATEVVSKLGRETPLPAEFVEKLLSPIASAIGEV